MIFTLRVARKTETSLPGAKINFGSEGGQILEVRILDKEFRETVAFLAGDTIVIRIQGRVDPEVKNPNIGILIRDERGYNIYGIDTAELGLTLRLDENHQTTVFFSLSPVLAAGSYSLAVWLCSHKLDLLLDKQVGVGVFQVIENNTHFRGIVDLQVKVYLSLSELENAAL